MKNALFPVLQPAPGVFDIQELAMPRSRIAALRRALTERAIFNDQVRLPDFLSTARQTRWFSDPDFPAETISDLDSWEQTPLGETFPATVAKVGRPVKELLMPALRANNKLRIIDPYLSPGRPNKQGKDREGQAVLALFGAAEAIQNITTITSIDSGDLAEPSQKLGDWLVGHGDRIARLHWHLIKKGDVPLHDRFLAFGRAEYTEENHWHAASLGYGIASLFQDQDKAYDTCVARISWQHFDKVWTQLLERVSWQVVIDSSNFQHPGSHWTIYSQTQRKGRWMTILKRTIPHRA